MKIALVTPGFSADETDTCIPALRDLVRRLTARFEVHVFALHHPARAGRYALGGAEVHGLGGGNRGGLARVILAARAARAIARDHRRSPFAVVHAFWADEAGLVAVRAGARHGIPAVVSLMGGELVALPDIEYGAQRGRYARYAIARALARADWFTAGSRQALARLRACHPRIASRSEAVPLGVDAARFQPGGGFEPAGSMNVLHVASLTPVKDQATLLRAFARVHASRPEVELRIVGDGPLRESLERLAHALGVAGRVRFLGERPHAELPAHYQRATICALASRHESQSVTVLEAAACGIATAGTAVGLLPELEPVCRTVPVGDDRALSTAMLALLDDAPGRGRLRVVARQMVERSFSIERTAAAFLDIYERLVTGTAPRAEPLPRGTETPPAAVSAAPPRGGPRVHPR